MLRTGKVYIKKGQKIAEKPFDKKLFESLCKIHCTKKEICGVMRYRSLTTLSNKCHEHYDRSFEEVYDELQAEGKGSLRQMQWKNAMSGNTAMQIWLGKQYLGQKEKSDITIDAPQSLQFVLIDGNADEEIIEKFTAKNE